MIDAVVFGAVNVDIGGFPEGTFRMRDSNPGRVRVSVGGVGHNIARCCALLGLRTELAAPLGGDMAAQFVENDCLMSGVGLRYARSFPEAASSVYLFLGDGAGEMLSAVNDMRIVERMTPEVLGELIPGMEAMDAAVVEANLPEEAILYLSERLRAPIVADTVSAAKAVRMKNALPRLSVLKLNALEAEALTGSPVRCEGEAREAVRSLLKTGVRRVFLTLGADGVCCGGEDILYLPALPCRPVNTTGAGDAFTAALLWAGKRGMDLRGCALAGQAAAAIALESPETVSSDLSEAALIKRMETSMGGNAKWI